MVKKGQVKKIEKGDVVTRFWYLKKFTPNIHNISWELVNKFEINQMNKKYEKTPIKHCNQCFKTIK